MSNDLRNALELGWPLILLKIVMDREVSSQQQLKEQKDLVHKEDWKEGCACMVGLDIAMP